MEDVEARRKFSLRQRQRSLAADEIAMTLEGDPDGELPFNIELQSFPQTNEVFPQAVLGGKALPSRSKNKFDTASICTIVSILITGVVIVFTIVALEARATGQQVPANALSPEPTNAIFDTPVTVLVTVPTTSTIIAAKLRARMARSEAELFPAQNGTETNESLDLVLRGTESDYVISLATLRQLMASPADVKAMALDRIYLRHGNQLVTIDSVQTPTQ